MRVLNYILFISFINFWSSLFPSEIRVFLIEEPEGRAFLFIFVKGFTYLLSEWVIFTMDHWSSFFTTEDLNETYESWWCLMDTSKETSCLKIDHLSLPLDVDLGRICELLFIQNSKDFGGVNIRGDFSNLSWINRNIKFITFFIHITDGREVYFLRHNEFIFIPNLLGDNDLIEFHNIKSNVPEAINTDNITVTERTIPSTTTLSQESIENTFWNQQRNMWLKEQKILLQESLQHQVQQQVQEQLNSSSSEELPDFLSLYDEEQPDDSTAVLNINDHPLSSSRKNTDNPMILDHLGRERNISSKTENVLDDNSGSGSGSDTDIYFWNLRDEDYDSNYDSDDNLNYNFQAVKNEVGNDPSKRLDWNNPIRKGANPITHSLPATPSSAGDMLIHDVAPAAGATSTTEVESVATTSVETTQTTSVKTVESDNERRIRLKKKAAENRLNAK